MAAMTERVHEGVATYWEEPAKRGRDQVTERIPRAELLDEGLEADFDADDDAPPADGRAR